MGGDGRLTADASRVSLVPALSRDGELRFDLLRGPDEVGWLRFVPVGAALRMTGHVRPESRGSGVATAAVGSACVALRSSHPGARVEVLVRPDAGAAQRVLEVNGFTCSDVTADRLLFVRTLADRPSPAG
jgi:RimJ/RimL family protein N-acetyltransferase